MKTIGEGKCPRCGRAGILKQFSDGLIDCIKCIQRFTFVEKSKRRTKRKE